jgi:sulfoquinovosyltransferase
MSGRRGIVARRSSRRSVTSAVAIPISPSEQQQLAVMNPRKVALFVEPSPFSHISGMKNRFECLIKCLRAEGDEVLVVTPDPNPPREYFGAKVPL